MDINYYEQTLRDISLSMFRKSFFGIFHGSISARIDGNKFLINKEEAIFDNLKSEDLVLLYNKKDYRWKNASSDSDIHLNIYANIKEAKFVCYAMPPYLVSYTFNHDFIIPKDYFSYIKFKKVEIYNFKNLNIYKQKQKKNVL